MEKALENLKLRKKSSLREKIGSTNWVTTFNLDVYIHSHKFFKKIIEIQRKCQIYS